MKKIKQNLPLITEIILALVLLVLTFRLFAINTAATFSADKAKLAIVIDDFGNNSAGTAEMLSLPVVFTGAVMPNMPYSVDEAKALAKNGKAVILHQPMQAHDGKLSWLGPNPILSEQTPAEAAKIFEENIKQLDYPKGFNNHMGSAVTEDAEKMDAIMQVAAENNMFFVDSVTTAKSVAEAAAKKYNVPYVKRDVFLDSTQDLETVKNNLIKAAEIAKKNGKALAIGHVGAEGGVVTAMAINQLKDEIEEMGVEFVPVGELYLGD
jgi:hypothetical protein